VSPQSQPPTLFLVVATLSLSLSPHITHQATRYPSGKIVGRHPSRGPHRQSTTTPTNQSRYLGIQKTSLASHPTDNKSKVDIKSREAGADLHESGGRCISPCSKRTYGEGRAMRPLAKAVRRFSYLRCCQINVVPMWC
jgi:hypothetical protein